MKPYSLSTLILTCAVSFAQADYTTLTTTLTTSSTIPGASKIPAPPQFQLLLMAGFTLSSLSYWTLEPDTPKPGKEPKPIPKPSPPKPERQAMLNDPRHLLLEFSEPLKLDICTQDPMQIIDLHSEGQVEIGVPRIQKFSYCTSVNVIKPEGTVQLFVNEPSLLDLEQSTLTSQDGRTVSLSYIEPEWFPIDTRTTQGEQTCLWINDALWSEKGIFGEKGLIYLDSVRYKVREAPLGKQGSKGNPPSSGQDVDNKGAAGSQAEQEATSGGSGSNSSGDDDDPDDDQQRLFSMLMGGGVSDFSKPLGYEVFELIANLLSHIRNHPEEKEELIGLLTSTSGFNSALQVLSMNIDLLLDNPTLKTIANLVKTMTPESQQEIKQKLSTLSKVKNEPFPLPIALHFKKFFSKTEKTSKNKDLDFDEEMETDYEESSNPIVNVLMSFLAPPSAGMQLYEIFLNLVRIIQNNPEKVEEIISRLEDPELDLDVAFSSVNVTDWNTFFQGAANFSLSDLETFVRNLGKANQKLILSKISDYPPLSGLPGLPDFKLPISQL